MNIIAPSILSADWAILAEEVKAVEAAGADWIHLDVMDGRFVPPITFGPKLVEAVRKSTSLPLDTHLMIVHPEKHIDAFKAAGTNSLTIHAEATTQLGKAIDAIRAQEMIVGVALNPESSLDSIVPYINDIDILLLMTVNPGWGGQPFIEAVLTKILAATNLIEKTGSKARIEVDGGINKETAHKAAAAGAQIFVAGNAIFQSKSYRDAIESLRVC